MEIRFDKKAKKFIEVQDAWDPDFTKVTPQEAQALAEAEEHFKNGEYVTMDEIDWN